MLQTFSKNKIVDFSEVLFVWKLKMKRIISIRTIGQLIGKKVYAINSEQRKALHVAAVFVNNFTNHMYKTGSDICAENKFLLLFWNH